MMSKMSTIYSVSVGETFVCLGVRGRMKGSLSRKPVEEK